MIFLCVAHRGAMGYEPENTLLSFQKAIELGASWIEFDVHYIDGELFVIHDDVITIDNQTINLYQCSSAQIRKIILEKKQKIPLLSEVLSLAKGQVSLNIELKGEDTGAATAVLLKQYIDSGSYNPSDFLISSYRYDELIVFSCLLSGVPTAVLTDQNLDEALKLSGLINAYSINIAHTLASRTAVEAIHQRNLKVLVFTVNTYEEIEELRLMGVDGVFTNYIDICHACRQAH